MKPLAPRPEDVVSPKVTAGTIGAAVAGAIGAGIVAAVAAATPELTTGLGPWGGVVFAGVTVAAGGIGSFLAGYATRDPLRRG